MVQRPGTANLPGNVHMAGEFFVAAELSKRSYLVSLTMGNAKAVDLFAERDARAICIQVKAAGGSYGWTLSADKTKIVENVLYVFVVVNVVGAGIYIPKIKDRKDAWHLIDEALREPGRIATIRRRTSSSA
jgi:hypothetical protein